MNKTTHTLSLSEGNLNRLMLRFSVPCILSLLISSLYNIVDQMFIGNSELSTLGNAATGVVFPVFIIAQAFAWCFGDGCAACLNIWQGKNDAQRAHRVLGNSIAASFLSGLLMIAVIYPLKVPILTLFGATENTLAFAIEYLNIILAAIPIYILCNMMNSIIRADGSPTFAMLSMLLGAVTNIILDPVFIFGLDMGMTGAALATVIGQGVTFVLTLWYFTKTKTFKLTLKSFALRPRALGEVMGLGVSTFITQIAIVVVAILSNVQFSKYGALSSYGADVPIAIIGIQSKIFTLVLNLVVGVALGCQPIVSYNMGAGNTARVRALYKKILMLTLATGLFFTLLFELIPGAILGMFGVPSNIPNPEDYWRFGKLAMRIFLSLTAIACVIKMNSIFFQAAGKPIAALVASTMRDVVCFVPLMFIFPLFSTSIEVLLFAAPLADLLAGIVTIGLCISFLRSLKPKAK